MERLEARLRRLATRAILLVTDKRRHPEIVERTTAFLQDRGAIGLLLDQYDSGESLETVALKYWGSRLERSAARLEDLVTTILVSLTTSIIAGIVVEAWKGEIGPLAKLFRAGEKEQLKLIAQKRALAEHDLGSLLVLYTEKGRGAGVTDAKIAQDIYEAVRAGRKMRDVLPVDSSSQTACESSGLLQYLPQIARSVIDTELRRGSSDDEFVIAPKPSDRLGLIFGPGMAFGEVIPASTIFERDPLSGTKILIDLLNKDKLNPELWPQSGPIRLPSPKILIVNETLYNGLRWSGQEDMLFLAGGLIGLEGGMTSHMAVMSRSWGVPAIGIPLPTSIQTDSRFALISDGTLRLYFDTPNLTPAEFASLMNSTRTKYNEPRA